MRGNVKGQAPRETMSEVEMRNQTASWGPLSGWGLVRGRGAGLSRGRSCVAELIQERLWLVLSSDAGTVLSICAIWGRGALRPPPGPGLVRCLGEQSEFCAGCPLAFEHSSWRGSQLSPQWAAPLPQSKGTLDVSLLRMWGGAPKSTGWHLQESTLCTPCVHLWIHPTENRSSERLAGCASWETYKRKMRRWTRASTGARDPPLCPPAVAMLETPTPSVPQLATHPPEALVGVLPPQRHRWPRGKQQMSQGATLCQTHFSVPVNLWCKSSSSRQDGAPPLVCWSGNMRTLKRQKRQPWHSVEWMASWFPGRKGLP